MSRRHVNVALFVPHAGCPHRCSFCDQNSISGHGRPVTAAQVRDACETALRTMPADAAQAEIAFFGGSFTALDPAYRRELLAAAYPYVQSGRFHGIRLSTRPDCIDEAILQELKAFGVTAVELGAQSMVDTVLAANRRGHTAKDTAVAAGRIKAHGFSLGLQMMTGLYGDTPEGAVYTARQLAALNPDAVRIYPTVVLRHTPLAALYAAGDYVPPTLEETVSLCAELLRFFEQEQQIPVIRLGLHAEASVEETCLAGPYHPALRELCESRLYLELAKARLCRFPAGTPVRLRVSPRAISRMVGQKRCNVEALKTCGYPVRIVPDETLPLWKIEAERQETNDHGSEIPGTSRI